MIVPGRDGEQARAVAEEIAKNAFHNVTYYNAASTACSPLFSNP